MPEEKRKSNHLIDETSPYLLQHAYNPVDWYPWGEEALTRARDEDRPILLSIGYSACHWCHVMERESFESEAIAGMMNELFVNIKVDREERPDLDEIYMGAVQAMTGSGGWPMTVFLTPDLRPFYGGTYFPPEDRYGHPGFSRVLQAVAQHYRDERDKVEENAERLMGALRQNAGLLRAGGRLGEGLLEKAFAQLKSSFDHRYGGFGSAPKFPGSMGLSLLLRHHRHSGSAEALEMVERTLKGMARGGIYDQLGGGFHRYSVDERWLVPHFEKMLYDNALLSWVYLEAYQVTGDEFYRSVVVQTLDYVLREMTRPEGGFYSTQDADSEGEEGRFFTWDPAEVEGLMGREDGALFMRYYDVTAEGNFEGGKSILHVEKEAAERAPLLGVEAARLSEVIERGRKILFAERLKRVAPARDDKILVAWNGLMISSMARASQVLEEERYLQAASRAADFILKDMRPAGELLHTYKDDRARYSAYQDDYACLINGLIDLFEAGFERRWLRAACELNEEMLARFWDGENGGFFFTEADAEDLIVRTKNPFDNPTPSGNSIGALVLLRLAGLIGDEALRARAERVLLLFGDLMERAPSGCAQMICALDFFQEAPCEVALVGNRKQRRELARVVHERFLPNRVLVGGDPAEDAGEIERELPLLAGKMDGDGCAYVCRNFTCSPPVRSREELEELVGALARWEGPFE